MKAAELRTGNFVFKGLEHKRANGVTIAFMESCEASDQTHHIEATPITNEWVREFGIVDGGKFPANEYFQIHRSQAGFKEWGLYFEDEFTGVYIKYVHELQNLYFALTGNELTIRP